MSSLSDKLPIDVIHYVILPFLANDYDTRDALNMVLAPHERKGTPFAKDATIKFRLIQAYPYIQRGIRFADIEKNLDIRANAIIELISILRKYSVILEYSENFRKTCIKKFSSFVEPTYYENLNVDPMIKNKLITESTSFLYDIENKYPFKYNIKCVSGLVSFIDGLGPPHIVDNSISGLLLLQQDLQPSAQPV
jgi:hypothetical protein